MRTRRTSSTGWPRKCWLYDVKPEIEAFDLSHIVQATRMAADGRLKGPLYVQFVMGVKNAMPADEPIFDFYIETLKRLAPDAQWCAAGIGPSQLTINEWSIKKGGHTRTGSRRQCAPRPRHARALQCRAGQKRAVDLCDKYERPVATWRQARALLGLASPQLRPEDQIMPAAPADSALYAGLLGDAETAALFLDAAEVEAMLRSKARWPKFRANWA